MPVAGFLDVQRPAFRFCPAPDPKRLYLVPGLGAVLDFSSCFGIFPILQVRENKRLKKSSKKVKQFLDKILFCGIVIYVERCAPVLPRALFLFKGSI